MPHALAPAVSLTIRILTTLVADPTFDAQSLAKPRPTLAPPSDLASATAGNRESKTDQTRPT